MLVDVVRDARKQQNIKAKDLDKHCYFKEDNLATCEEFESNPSKMTQEIFCRAACMLHLRIDDVLDIKLSPKKLEEVIATMDLNNGGLAAALYTKEAKDIPDEEVAPIYARFKILSEI